MEWLKRLFGRKDGHEATVSGNSPTKKHYGKLIAMILAAVILFSLVVMIMNYRFPQFFDLEDGNLKPGMA
ncbi:MAG: hypothetical protein HQK55_07170, partial [Deltaproteobacteria bacterium]|nr:hypothetical protein [Deltaproteobacteria bacterium]